MASTLAARFWAKVSLAAHESCWEWLGAKRPTGYGNIGLGGRNGGTGVAHRVAWELTRGSIPAGLEVDHLCRNRGCVNPRHMELVTRAENMRRQARATSPICGRGHLYEGRRARNGRRECLPCRRIRDRKRRPSRAVAAGYIAGGVA